MSGIADVAYLHEISSVWEESHPGDGRLEEQSGIVTSIAETASTSTNEVNNGHGEGGRGSVVSVNEACISLGVRYINSLLV